VVDREGYTVNLPETISSIVSIGPPVTEILVALGFGSQIISADMFSSDVYGIAEGISVLDMMALDAEFIINLQPDVIFVTGMTRFPGQEDPLGIVSRFGIPVVFIPVSADISGIILDILFISEVMGAEETGKLIVYNMESEIAAVRRIAEGIADRRTVYFEISPAPWLYSSGSGTYLAEMLGIAGANNVLADFEGWMPLSDELILMLNPDVILTSTDFLDDPLAEIAGRPGWHTVTAVQNGDIFYICANASSRPNHNIILAIRQIAHAVYPEYFANPNE
jgi:iron complex transport system substrate-binding protein